MSEIGLAKATKKFECKGLYERFKPEGCSGCIVKVQYDPIEGEASCPDSCVYSHGPQKVNWVGLS